MNLAKQYLNLSESKINESDKFNSEVDLEISSELVSKIAKIHSKNFDSVSTKKLKINWSLDLEYKKYGLNIVADVPDQNIEVEYEFYKEDSEELEKSSIEIHLKDIKIEYKESESKSYMSIVLHSLEVDKNGKAVVIIQS